MKWIKDNGITIELNDRPETVAKAESLGWKLEGKPETEKPAPKKRGRPAKDK